jgi:hypothetical protein
MEWNYSSAEKSQSKKDLEKYVFNLGSDLYNILNIHQVLKSYLMFNFNWSGSMNKIIIEIELIKVLKT